MAQKKDQSVSSEVKSRLEELFIEDDGSANEAVFDKPQKPEDDVLRELKAVVLSVDWEINDETLSNLMNQIEALKEVYHQDRILLLFLQLLGKLGTYIKVKKADAHPDSMKLLNSAYQSFEKAARNSELTESDRKKLLQIEVSRYIKLQEKIQAKKFAPDGKIPGSPYPGSYRGGKSEMAPELAVAIEEIKKMIRSEFDRIRAELRMWMENRP